MRVPCAFSVEPEWLEKIDARCKSLGLSRSAYLLQLVRRDLLEGGDSFRLANASNKDSSGESSSPFSSSSSDFID